VYYTRDTLGLDYVETYSYIIIIIIKQENDYSDLRQQIHAQN